MSKSAGDQAPSQTKVSDIRWPRFAQPPKQAGANFFLLPPQIGFFLSVFEADRSDGKYLRFKILFADFEDWTFVATDGDSFEVDAESQVIRFGVVVPLGG